MSNSEGVLLRHLPAIYQVPEMGDLHALLEVFEAILLGFAGDDGADLAEGDALARKIRKIPSLFDPARTPAEFLPWLSRWVALSRTEGLPEDRLRRLIGESVALYAWRGTKTYLHAMLQFFLPDGIAIKPDDIIDHGLKGCVVGCAKLGWDSWIGGDQPFCFLIKIGVEQVMSDSEALKKMQRRSEAIIRSVVDLAKPAHTSYQLQWKPAGQGTVPFL